MTGQTGIVLVDITHHTLVFLIGLRIQVTGYTGKLSVIGGIFMAFHALVPDSFVLAGIHRKVKTVVVECGGDPGFFTVTLGTILRKLSYGMIGIFGLIKIRFMTAHTGIGRVAKTIGMAGLAIIGNKPVGIPEHIKLIVDVKSCGTPAGIRGMTGSTIGRKI
jgi:hypothetical protein